jgi:predicted AAA+ superfamily ATPase
LRQNGLHFAISEAKMETARRFLRGPNGSFFLFGPRGTGKSTWLLYLGKDRLESDGIAVTPCEAVLRQLVAGQSSIDG